MISLWIILQKMKYNDRPKDTLFDFINANKMELVDEKKIFLKFLLQNLLFIDRYIHKFLSSGKVIGLL